MNCTCGAEPLQLPQLQSVIAIATTAKCDCNYENKMYINMCVCYNLYSKNT